MRNLKRALSLAMASVMVLGMMVVGAGAVSYDDFSDKDKIVNDDAVSMLVELNVINGKDDGSFDPEGIVTRAEMAKMICVVLNGGKDPSLGNVSNYTYTDTVGHWAAAYIEYCTTLGIVAGDGTGKFNPSNTVTGAEAAKMLLVALGFKSEIEGFTGANWAVNVNVRANQKGLFDELSINPSEGLTRDNAAQMVWNALDAGVVSYDYTLITDGSSITSSPTLIDNESKTLLTDKFKVAKLEGVIVANENATSTGTAVEKEDVTVLLLTSDDAGSKQDEGDTITLKTATAANLLGKSVTMFAKDWKNGAYQTVLGNPVVSSDNMIATISESSDADDVKDALKAAGIKEVSKAVLVENFIRATDKDDKELTISGMADVAKLTGNGIEVIVISNDNDNKADFVIRTKMIAGKVSAYNAKGNDGDGYITVSALVDIDEDHKADRIAGAEFADVKGSEDLAKDDIVLYYRVGDTFYAEKADSVNVTVTSTKGSDTIKDGKNTYKASALSSKYDDDNNTVLTTAVEPDDEVTLYLDNFGYVVYTDAVTAADEYMFITGSDASVKDGFESLTIKGVLSDGTEVTASVNKLDSKKLSTAFDGKTEDQAQEMVNNKIVTYTKTGEKYNITVKDNTKITQIEKNKASLGGATANSKTIFVIGDKNDNYKVYTGISNVPDVTSSSLYCYAKSGVAKFVVALDATTSDGDTNGIYILGKTASAKKDGDDTIYVVEAYVNDEYVAELELDGYTKGETITRGYYAGVSTSGGNTVDWDDIKKATPDSGSAVTDFGDGIISSETTSALTYDKDTIVIIVDGTKHIEGGDIDEIVYVEDDTDASSKVVLVEGTGSDEGHADYVFIIR
ncbi:S-layer homology domain-containing protein [Intestinimonas butyriciproducens]|uniref:S-layer homology domain-containing protein n=1 Tax=Intestinimonas butyriciproducens TaxID=1297617 RepID=UPI00232E6F09|nr:S-layer homology domain-containing protein [Intestinimonas butyriciproducens]MDB7861434.1 S-layer homology domain-containing protein [Intestinimonas butyriciproducens]MDB7864564.1 S-layer homology domain-containing protein [Intestinimonas butyriciproducens]